MPATTGHGTHDGTKRLQRAFRQVIDIIPHHHHLRGRFEEEQVTADLKELDRRTLLMSTALGIGVLALRPGAAFAAGQTVTLADIGVGDPNGDWSGYTNATGNKVNVVSIGNGPSAVLNQLIAGGWPSNLRHHQHRRRHAEAAG